MDLDLDLDTSWIEKEEKRFSFELNQEKIVMDSIVCYFVYIDKNNSIQKVVKHNEKMVSLFPGSVGIPNSRILQLIEKYRFLENGVKYKISNVFKYIIELEGIFIKDFVYHSDYENHFNDYLKDFSLLNDLVIEPSVFLFHPLNSLYFFFKETSINMKSILKNNVSNKHTNKRVQMIDSSSHYFHIKTRKKY
jgi:hypothetical protein